MGHSKTTSASGPTDSPGTGGAPSPSPERVVLSLESEHSDAGPVVIESTANVLGFLLSVRKDLVGDGFTFTLSWDGLTHDQALLIATALGLTGREWERVQRRMRSGEPISFLSTGGVVRVSTVPNMPPRPS